MDNKKGEYVPPGEFSNVAGPLITTHTPPIVRNQSIPNPSEIDNLQAALKTSSQFVSCPYCRNQAMTRMESKCNIINSLCCAFTVGVLWLPLQLIRGKDINCKDASHFCSRCGHTLSNYKAC